MSALVLRLAVASIIAAGAFGPAPALAQSFNSGSTGADGAFSPTANTTLTLPPDGVFNFTTINIPSGVTVKFIPNVANTPVTLLASGNVIIAGTIDVSGGPGGGATVGTNLVPNGGIAGPGGAAGASGSNSLVTPTGGAGLGAGGGPPGTILNSLWQMGGSGGGFGAAGAWRYVCCNQEPAGTGGVTYGSPTLLPVIGGSCPFGKPA